MKRLLTGLCMMAAAPALAQDAGWSYTASGYLWFPQTEVAVDTPRGTIEGSLSISDALNDLDFAVMAAVEARRGRWGLIGDFVYFDLTSSAPTPAGLAFSKVAVGTRVTFLSGYALYRLHEDATTTFDVGAGLRYTSVDIDTTLVGAGLPSESFATSDDWIDPLIAARLRVGFSDRWFGVLFADAGGFGVGADSTWQVLATVGYRFNDQWSVQAGYRYLEIERDVGNADFDLSLSGPVLGVSYRF